MANKLSLHDREQLREILLHDFDKSSLQQSLQTLPLNIQEIQDHIGTILTYGDIVEAVIKEAEKKLLIPELLRALISKQQNLRQYLQNMLDRCRINLDWRPLVEDLKSILQQCPQLESIAKQCFKESLPLYSSEWVQFNNKLTALEYADHLSVFGYSEKIKTYPILYYVHQLIKSKPVQSIQSQYSQLKNWMRRAALSLADNQPERVQELLNFANHPTQPTVRHNYQYRSPTLFVKLEPTNRQKTQFKVSMWFTQNANNIPLPRAQLMKRGEIRNELQRCLNEIASECDWQKIEIHFILPYELLGWDVDQWRIYMEGSPIDQELGYICPVFIRSLERINGKQLLNSLKSRWQRLAERSHILCQWVESIDHPCCRQPHAVICMPPQCAVDFYKYLDQITTFSGAVLHPAPARLSANDKTATLYHLFQVGVPVILWLRSTNISRPDKKAISFLKTSIDGKSIQDLPKVVWEWRRRPMNPDCPNNPITLIWDDPNWLPELIEQQAQLRS